MKNILTGCRMRKILFIAVCIRSSLWGEVCYSAETVRFDIITIVGDEINFKIEHIEEAFYPPLF